MMDVLSHYRQDWFRIFLITCHISLKYFIFLLEFFWINDSNQQQWGSVWPRLYSELFSRPAFYPSPSFLEILLPCNLQPAFRKCQITAKTERKILITQDFPELTTGSFEYIVYAATLKVLSFTLLLECVVLLFHSMGGTPSKYISCFSLRNVCCNHVISLLISITIFFFISFAIWCDWICCKKIFLLNLSDL